MDNPYTKEQILRLVERKFESAKVDYKKSYPLDDKHKREIIKDVMAMANTIDTDDSLVQDGFEGGHGFIIIGSDEDGNLYDISENQLDDNAFQQIVNEYVEPKINFNYISFEHEVDEKSIRFGVILVAPSDRPPHRIKKTLHKVKDVPALRVGTCFMRVGSSTTENVSDAELESMFEYRASISEVEQKLQKEEFRIPQEDRDRLAQIYVPPNQEIVVEPAWNILENRNFLVLVGEIGVGKRSLALHFAQQLLSERRAFRLLQPSRFASFNDLRGVDGAIIIVPDAFGLYHFERRDIENDIGLMHEMIKNNYIILTTSGSVLDETLRDTRLEEWDLLKTNQIQFKDNAYQTKSKRTILENHIKWAAKQGRLDEKQAGDLLTFLNNNLKAIDFKHKLRLPLDIRRFVDDRLSGLKSLTEQNLDEILLDFGNLERQINHWFINLTPDQQAFLFSLALFDGLDQKSLWEWYSLIVFRIRKLIPTLATQPLGLMAHHTTPYVVIRAGKPTFAHPSFHEILLKTIADVYREPFSLLTDDFIKKSLPADESDEAIIKSQPMRDAIAMAASRMAEYGLDDLKPILESWASFKKGRVRIPAAMVVSQAAGVIQRRSEAISILNEWSENADSAIRWTSVVSYGLLSKVAPAQGIAGLKKMAADRDKTVISGIPKALRAYSQINPTDAKRLYTTLAANRDKYTRREISRSLKTISYKNQDFVLDLLKMWSTMESKYRRWTLVRTCLVVPRRFPDARFGTIVTCMQDGIRETRNALYDALTEEDLTLSEGWEIMNVLVDQFELNSFNFPVLLSALEEVAPIETWNLIKRWVDDKQKREVRLAATNFLVYMKSSKPEEAVSLLTVLANDSDEEIASNALMDPPIDITTLDFSEDEIEEADALVIDGSDLNDTDDIFIEIIDESD